MKIILKIVTGLCLLLCAWLIYPSSSIAKTKNAISFRFSYKNVGLSDNQAAAHLLSRFTYGATPGQVDAVVRQGLENWFRQQLDSQLPDDTLKDLLSALMHLL